MKTNIYIFLLITSLLVGCNKKNVVDPAIEEFIASQPDSAVNVLENIYMNNDLNEYNKAYYYILLAEAQIENGVSLIKSDSLLDLALSYCKRNNYPDLHAKAYLFKGRIYNELGQSKQAVETLLKGINIEEKIDADSETLLKLYDELGKMYLYEFSYEKALNIFRKEYEIDKKKGESRGLAFSLRNIGNVYDFMQEPDSAFYYYQEALIHAKQSPDSTYLSDIIHNDLSIWYQNNNKYDQALEQMKLIANPTDNSNLQKADLFILFNQLDSAKNLLHATLYSPDIYIRAVSNELLSKIEKKKGNYEDAFDYYEIYKLQSDSIFAQTKTAELEMVNNIYHIERESTRIMNEYKAKTNKVIISFIAVGIIIIVFLIVLRKNKRIAEIEKEKNLIQLRKDMFYKEKENDELNNHIKDLQDEIAKMEQTKSINDEKMKAQIRQKEEEILLLEDELSNRRFKTKPIYEQLIQIARDKKGKLDMKELEKEICQSYHDYIIRLKQEYPPIDEQEILMICLKKAGFSSSEIGHFLHCSGSKVRQRIYQLNQKQTAI